MDKRIFDDASKKVIRGLPFYSYIYARTKKIYDDSFVAMAGMTVDRTTARPVMIINKKMIEEKMEEFNIPEDDAPQFIAGIIQHELDHYILGHVFTNPKTMYGRMHELFNIAADSSINRYIDPLKKLSGTPEDYFEGTRTEEEKFFAGSKELSDFSAESMFTHLLKYLDKDQMKEVMEAIAKSGQQPGDGDQEGEGEEGSGEGEGNTDIRGNLDSHGQFGVPGDVKEAAQNFRDSVIKESFQKSRGLVPGHLQGFIQEILKGKINWRKELKKFSGKGILGRRVETLMRPNRRFEDQPGHRVDEEGKIGVILDTSGSMSEKELAKAFSEIDRLTQRQRKFYLVQYDAEVTSVDRYRRGAWKKIKIKGRGGTNMGPALQKMQEMRIRRLVCITDGWDYFDTERLKQFKVLFLFTKEHCENFEANAKAEGFKTLVMED